MSIVDNYRINPEQVAWKFMNKLLLHSRNYQACTKETNMSKKALSIILLAGIVIVCMRRSSSAGYRNTNSSPGHHSATAHERAY